MTGKEVVATLLKIISEADLEQEAYFKEWENNSSRFVPIDSIQLDYDKGLIFTSKKELIFFCENCSRKIDQNFCYHCSCT